MAYQPEHLLRRLLGQRGYQLTDEQLLDAAHRGRHKFAVTLLSAWRAQGRTLPPHREAELAAQVARLDRYDALYRELVAIAPGVRQLRGNIVRELYPPGLVRQQNDLDLFCPNERQLWVVAVRLVDSGWTVHGMWLVHDGNHRHLSVVFERAHSDPALPYRDRIELLTQPLEGDYWRISPRSAPIATSPLVTALVYLLDEGVSRPFGARDAYDALLLLAALAQDETTHESLPERARGSLPDRACGSLPDWACKSLPGRLAEAAAAVRAARLHPEWYRLTALLRRVGEEPVDVLGPGATIALLNRRLNWLRHAAHPVRLGVLAAAHRLRLTGSAAAARALTAMQTALGARRLLNLAVPMFGVALAQFAHPELDTTELHIRGPYAELHTPVGVFALSAGGDIPAAWLARTRNSDSHAPCPER